MKLTPFDIYLWQQADVLHIPMMVSAIAVTLFAIGFTVCLFSEMDCMGNDEDIAKCFWRSLKSSSLALAMWFIWSLAPSSKTIAMMHVIPAVANSDPIQKDLPELYNMAKEAMKEMAGKK